MKRLEKSKQTFVNWEETIRWGCIQCRISKDLILKALASQSSQSSAKSSYIRKKHLNGRREYEKMKKIYIYIESKDGKKEQNVQNSYDMTIYKQKTTLNKGYVLTSYSYIATSLK